MMIITWDNAAQKAAGMGVLAARVGSVHVKDWGEDVGEEGRKEIVNIIDIGGVNSTKKGGPRVQSGAMRDSAETRTYAAGGLAFVRAGFGVDSSTPMWTPFQEGGTSRGVSAMLAIPRASTKMETAAQDVGEKMMKSIQGEWNAI